MGIIQNRIIRMKVLKNKEKSFMKSDKNEMIFEHCVLFLSLDIIFTVSRCLLPRLKTTHRAQLQNL